MKGGQSTPRLFAVALTMAILVASCQHNQPTIYRTQETGFGGKTDGYTDQKVGENEYSIVAAGNTATTRERTAQLALLRAARLTLELGYQRFAIIHKTSTLRQIGTVHMIPIPGVVAPIPVGFGSVGRPTAIIIIRLVDEGGATAEAIDAKSIEKRLAPVFE